MIKTKKIGYRRNIPQPNQGQIQKHTLPASSKIGKVEEISIMIETTAIQCGLNVLVRVIRQGKETKQIQIGKEESSYPYLKMP